MAVVIGCNRRRRTSERHLPLPPSLSFSLSPILLALYPNESVFSEGERPPAAALKRGTVLHCSRRQTTCDAHQRLTLAQRNNTHVHTGRLVDHHCHTLHSKCTFSWRSCTVFPLRMSPLTLFCTRQLLLNTVYLHLSAISLDCFFDFYFLHECLFPISRVSVKVSSHLSVWIFDGGICLSRYLCRVLVLICIPSQYEYSKVGAMCG